MCNCLSGLTWMYPPIPIFRWPLIAMSKPQRHLWALPPAGSGISSPASGRLDSTQCPPESTGASPWLQEKSLKSWRFRCFLILWIWVISRPAYRWTHQLSHPKPRYFDSPISLWPISQRLIKPIAVWCFISIGIVQYQECYPISWWVLLPMGPLFQRSLL